MVSTRASQASQEPQPAKSSRKRRASSVFSEAGSQASKARKTHGRRFTTADEQLLEEERLSNAGSRDGTAEPAPAPKRAHTTPTHSRHGSRLSLPANLQLPSGVKFEPLQKVLAKELARRRRTMEEMHVDGAALELEEGNSTTFVELADLDIDGAQLMTPKNRTTAVAKHTPSTLVKKPSPGSAREDEIIKYEDALEKVTKEKADLAAQLQITMLAVRSLGFGTETMPEADIFCVIRETFDELRAQESDMPIDLPWENLSNAELLEYQPAIVRGLLQDIEQYKNALEECESHLQLTDAE